LFGLPQNGAKPLPAEQTYSLQYGNALLLALDVTAPIEDQTAWLEEQLAQSTATWMSGPWAVRPVMRPRKRLRALLRTHAIVAPRRVWTKKGLAWLRQEEMPTPAARLKRDLLLDELTEAKRRVRTVTKALDEIGEHHPTVLLLRTIPGVGIRTAETVAAYMDKAQRFLRSAQVGAYFGLVPCQDASAGVNRLGHITRQGPATARKYLVEAAWQGVYRSPTIRAYFERVQHGRPERRKVALVATAHYLLRCMHAMLVRNQPWHEAA
jgi:transposase